jgi:hypothetical protein
MLRAAAIAASLVIGTAVPSGSANASSCVNPVTVSIQFQRGARCWTYRGDATHFVGQFRAGQTVVVSSTGIANFGDGSWEWQTTTIRDVSAEGPGGTFIDPDEAGESSFRAPRTGRYTFSFSPCAMWRAPGVFVVCAR